MHFRAGDGSGRVVRAKTLVFMGGADEPSLTDIRRVFRLLNECLDRWADPQAWQSHLLREVCDIAGGVNAQLQLMRPGTSPDRPEIVPLAWFGDPAHRQHYLDSLDPETMPAYPGFGADASPALDGGAIGFTRRMVIPDEAWHASRLYREFVAPIDADEFAIGMSFAPHLEGVVGIASSRARGAPPIPPVVAATLAILAEEVAPLIGVRLALADQTSMHGLTARQRQTLELLLDGLSEKQVARAMGVKLSTVHSYVVELHRHFDVSSRGELMSYFVKRTPKPLADENA